MDENFIFKQMFLYSGYTYKPLKPPNWMEPGEYILINILIESQTKRCKQYLVPTLVTQGMFAFVGKVYMWFMVGNVYKVVFLQDTRRRANLRITFGGFIFLRLRTLHFYIKIFSQKKIFTVENMIINSHSSLVNIFISLSSLYKPNLY